MTYKQETIKPYNDNEAKGKQVEQMFDNIAPSYDLLNHTLSFGIDRRWRRTAIESLMPYAPKRVLDVATGTGDFALLAAQMLQPESLVGIDLSDGMLQVAREKLRTQGEALPITGPSIPTAFGVRERASADAENNILPSKSACGISLMSLNLLIDNPQDPVAIAFACLVDGIGKDLEKGVLATLDGVGAKNDARTLAHAVGALEGRDTVVAVRRLGGFGHK